MTGDGGGVDKGSGLYIIVSFSSLFPPNPLFSSVPSLQARQESHKLN